jgi:trehalose 6-phosphate synthase
VGRDVERTAGVTGQESASQRLRQDLVAQLRDLHLRAGEPSTRRIAEEIGNLSHTTVHGMLRGDRLPRQQHLLDVVARLGGDRERFRQLWIAARQAELARSERPAPRPAAPGPRSEPALTAPGHRESGAEPAVEPAAEPAQRGRATGPGGHELVLVSYRLPEPRVLDLRPEGALSTVPTSTLDSVLATLAVRRNCGWVGWNDRAAGLDAQYPPGTVGTVTRHPVALTPAEVEDHYEGYANSTIWPLYHDVIEPPRFEPAWARANETVNQRFARVVARVAAPGAMVWVHDYQLQLLPGMLRRLRKDLRIGFFLHIPWPPVELFSRMPDRKAVLRGLLGADVVGFQRRLSVENFLAAVGNLLELWPRGGALRVGGRPVLVRDFPISVDTAGIERFARSERVLDEADRLRRELGRSRTVLVGVDRLDYTKGIEQRLEAYRQLLEEKRLSRTSATLVQLVTPSRENLAHYGQLRDRVDRAVGSLNARYGRVGSPVVHYVQQMNDREEIMALYRVADVMLVTPFRDGMNLVAKEYVASRGDNRGALVLSEFAGAAAELREAVVVNPYDLTALKDAIVTAVEMDQDEQARRMSSMRQHLLAHDLGRWTSTFIAALAAPDNALSAKAAAPR